MPEIARQPNLDYGSFVLKHLVPRVPVVVPGASANAPAVRRWTPQSLAERFGERPVRVERAGAFEKVPLAEYAASITGAEGAGEPAYMRNISLLEQLPELIEEVELPVYTTPNWLASDVLQRFVPPVWVTWIELFLSGPGMRFPRVHVDTAMTHAWVVQVWGRKRFWAWPPMENQPNYSIHSDEQMKARGLDCRGRDLEAFFSHSAPFTGDLEPGDFLFLPTGWWHTAESVTACITLSGNFVNETNWDDFCESWFRGLKFKEGLPSLAEMMATGSSAPSR
jgi:hypothetical protein